MIFRGRSKLMFCFHVFIIIIAILVCYRWGDWRNWQTYYPTILFFMMGDFIYLVLFRKTMLWMYNTDILNHTLVNLLVIFTVYPATILTFIPYFPRSIYSRVGYILLWVTAFSIIEFISHRLGCFIYYNSWNLGWSIIFCIIMFPLQYVHFKKPLMAWFLATIELMVFIIIFDVDLMGLI